MQIIHAASHQRAAANITAFLHGYRMPPCRTLCLTAAFVVISFASAFYVLFRHAHYANAVDERLAAGMPAAGTSGHAALDDDDAAPLSLWNVLALLVESSMKGEPDHIVLHGTDGTNGFVWGVMFLFGVIVVLLLLNLLIARFAKTFDVVHENVDANFKVAFARVVIESRAKELLPPPLNILRLLIAKGLAMAMASVSSLQQPGGLLYWLWPSTPLPPPVNQVPDAAHHSTAANEGDGGGDGHGARSPLVRTPSKRLMAVGVPRSDDPDDLASGVGVDAEDNLASSGFSTVDREARAGSGWVVDRVRDYIEHALAMGKQSEGEGLVAQVVEFVCRHQHDIGKEEQWRTEMNRQVYNVEVQCRKDCEALSVQLARTTEAIERIAAAVGADPGSASARTVGEGTGRGIETTEGSGHQHPRFDLLRKLERALPGLVDLASQSESLAATQRQRFEQIDSRMRAHTEAVDRKLQEIDGAVRSMTEAGQHVDPPTRDETSTYLV